MATASHSNTHQGTVKDPEHDGRLKENREEGRTKGTTPGSQARAEHRASSESGHRSQHQAGGQEGGRGREDNARRESGSHTGGSDDLRSREYKDADGEVHHHTRTYMEQHHGEQGKK
jgi:hypothetical protein